MSYHIIVSLDHRSHDLMRVSASRQALHSGRERVHEVYSTQSAELRRRVTANIAEGNGRERGVCVKS